MQTSTIGLSLYVLFLLNDINWDKQRPCSLGESRAWTQKDLRRSSEAFARDENMNEGCESSNEQTSLKPWGFKLQDAPSCPLPLKTREDWGLCTHYHPQALATKKKKTLEAVLVLISPDWTLNYLSIDGAWTKEVNLASVSEDH